MKHYEKRRASIRAVQWTGELTPDVTELVGPRKAHVDDARRQLILGGGWYARVGDWILSISGEDLSVLSDEAFRKTYEEVAVAGDVSKKHVTDQLWLPEVREDGVYLIAADDRTGVLRLCRPDRGSDLLIAGYVVGLQAKKIGEAP